MVWVLISNGVVVNTVVAEQAFIDLISDKYDKVMQFQEGDSYPGPGDLEDGNGGFIPAHTGMQVEIGVTPKKDVIEEIIDSLLTGNTAPLTKYVQ